MKKLIGVLLLIGCGYLNAAPFYIGSTGVVKKEQDAEFKLTQNTDANKLYFFNTGKAEVNLEEVYLEIANANFYVADKLTLPANEWFEVELGTSSERVSGLSFTVKGDSDDIEAWGSLE